MKWILFKKYTIIVALSVCTHSIAAQNIAIYNAYILEKPKVITPVIGNDTNWGHEPNVVFELSYDLKETLKLGLRYFYDDYPGFVGYQWEPSDNNIRLVGSGYGHTKMTRFGIFGAYELFQFWNKISISGRAYLDFQSYKSQFREPDIRTKEGNISIGGYTGPDVGEEYLTTYDKWQLLPSIGMSLSYRPFWKVVLYAEVFYSHGFVTHSRLEFEYTDLEEVQPTAEYLGNGTSFAYAFGLGFRLWE